MTHDQTRPQKPNLDQFDSSDGSQLIPAEVQAKMRKHDDNALTEDVAIPGSTVDDEGLINNFATEPKIYPSTYPSPPQQRQYVLWGLGAILFVAILVFISFSVS